MIVAIALHVDKLEADGTIRVRHTFFGETEADCESIAIDHAAGCKAFGPAFKEGNIIERFEEVDEIPEWEDRG
jgi:hypothetical protein